MTDLDTRKISLYIRPCSRESKTLLLVVYAHELGHAIDFAHLDQRRHKDWLRARHRSGAQWFGCNECSDFNTGAGDFAETYAYYRTGDAAAFSSTLAPLPTPREMRTLIPMFDVNY